VSQSLERPKITVVTPALDAAATIEETLRSVREQGYPNVEHVVVDGGSTDGTVEILRRSDGIRWISDSDDGLSDAMNKGIAMAEGEIVGWLNADDFYLPEALEKVARAFESDPEATWLTGYCRIVGGDGREIRKPVTAYKNWLLRHYSFARYLTQNFISAPATFVRKDAYPDPPYETRYRISMDYDTQLKLARERDPIVLREELSAFRMIEGTLSMSGFERQLREHAENARTHGDGHPFAVAYNQAFSVALVQVYRVLRGLRRLRAA
jgi:glycosyltransferase involved in cell wall biosynthesis